MEKAPHTYGIVGLGNPGKEYRDTRHNVGFKIVDILARNHNIKLKRRWRFKARTGSGRIAGKAVILIQPLTYMNLSGSAVRAVLSYYRIDPAAVVVALDDANLEVGRVRIRRSGGHGGHKGLASVIDAIGSRQFCRVRLGVGGGSRASLKDYVLGDFAADELSLVGPALNEAAESIETLLNDGVDAAMNKYNKKPET